MKLGSEQHKELFCRHFLESHLPYEPEQLPWPDLDSDALQRLRAIPFWKEALHIETEAGVMVSTFASKIEDPLLHEAIALQGYEEQRHSRLIKFLIDHYGVDVPAPGEVILPANVEGAFTNFGFEECLDSYFAFGMFGLAREAGYFPEAMFQIFDPILYEEARHIVFFVNWFTYLQIQRGWGWSGFRAANTLKHYGRALWGLVKTFGGLGDKREGQAFSVTGASSFVDELTLELLLTTCLAENDKRMQSFPPELLQPQLLPTLSKLALRMVRLLPKRQAVPSAQQG